MAGSQGFGPARSSIGGPAGGTPGSALLGDDLRFPIFLAFVALVFATGGGSRDDILSLVVLRPACAFFAAYALTMGSRADFARVRVPLLLLLALGGWMVIQSIPLPPELWQALPGRGAIAALDRLAGLDGIWRPISLSPSKTLNSLGSLAVPLAGLLLYAVLPTEARRRIPLVLAVAAAASALLGIAQIAAGGHGLLYLYAITNEGNPVGLFSNRNHNAVFLGATLIFLGYLAIERPRQSEGRRPESALARAMPAAGALLLLVVLLINGSRAGLLVGVLALGFLGAYYALALLAARRSDTHRSADRWQRNLGFAGMGAAGLIGLALLFSNSPSIDRLIRLSVADELRVRVFPQIVHMAQDNWLFGIGFGAFEHVFRSYETTDLLQPTYLNNAHNDWMQWIVEGGLPAVLIAGVFAVWLVRVCLGHWRVRAAAGPRTRLVACAVAALSLLMLASGLDYPLRTPSLMLFAILLIGIVADPPEVPAGTGRSSRRAKR